MNRYITVFVVFSFFGWVWESIYCTICRKKWANRGFLYGPICPIYGFGCIVAYGTYELYLFGILPLLTWWQIFVFGFVLSMILEYPTSLILEKSFHARWWDYSKVPLNIDGRTSVPTSIAFGAVSIVIMKFLIPYIRNVIYVIPDWIITLFAFVFVFIISADITLTLSALTDFQNRVKRFDDSFQNHLTDAVDQMLSAGNGFHLKAVKRIVIFKYPIKKIKVKSKYYNIKKRK